MRARGRIDSNQNETVKALRSAGMSVQILSAVGNGCPDLLVGFKKRNYLIELKDGAKFPSKQELTTQEQEWRDSWAGLHIVANTPNAAVLAVIEADLRGAE